ncbi:MAG: xanthine dehydrogenase family protein subunit M [Deltaproteobacteria bacterium]|nr:xanthine dehydrogenase family protein subunit M [Deltaproteobacteria bacterium]
MIPPSFDYYSPSSFSEAVKLLAELGEDARLIAGGQSLLPMLKLRLIRPKAIIDLFKVKGLSHIREKGRYLQIGSLTTERSIERSPLIRKGCPVLSEAASHIGDIHIRNLGTVGGSLCHADPSADLAPTLLALGATFTVKSIKGSRVIDSRDFFAGPYMTHLSSNEILSQIQVPKFNRDTSGAYVKLMRKAGDFAIIGAAVVLHLDQRGECQQCSIALCGAAPWPVLSERGSQVLLGSRLTDVEIARASELAKNDADPISDIHASAEYRREMIPVIVSRALRQAKERLGGGA